MSNPTPSHLTNTELTSVRKVPVRTAPVVGPAATASIASAPAPSPPSAPLPVVPPARPALVRPLAPERYEVRFTASAETCAKLRRAQELLRHAVPSGDPAAIVDRALTLLVADLERKKLGATDRPRPRPTIPVSARKPPADMRRAVCRRDGDRCAYVSKDGRRCEERGFLEFHHVIPYAMGGETTVENIQLRCRAHNRYEAGLFYRQGEHRESGGFVREQAVPYGGAQLGPDRVRPRSDGGLSAPA